MTDVLIRGGRDTRDVCVCRQKRSCEYKVISLLFASQEPSGKTKPSNTLIWTFSLLNCWENKFVLSHSPSLWYFNTSKLIPSKLILILWMELSWAQQMIFNLLSNINFKKCLSKSEYPYSFPQASEWLCFLGHVSRTQPWIMKQRELLEN